ncbi:helix-turn-helix domain-containing protein [Levilactobacillus yonginensis]|jgi:transcriptional regulator with XRE-family HTH domain|uniref:helix-turn-helix domain-containing protein n=1 Tax=Levilactobacillus yonginensis TaxID=1054041 RepID=UPI00345CFCD8
MNDFDYKFPEVLKFIRNHTPYQGKKRLSLRKLSELSGVSTPYISQLEQFSQQRKPSMETVSKLATGLTVPTKANQSDMFKLLSSTAGYSKIDPRVALKITKTLPNVKFSDFLQLVLGYTGTINLDENNEERIANEAYKNWDNSELETVNELLYQYKLMRNNIHLEDCEDGNHKIMLDSKDLTKVENIVLLGAIKTIRELRNNGK